MFLAKLYLVVGLVFEVVFSERLFSAPLKLTGNEGHFMATLKFGVNNNSFDLDVVLDTGSGHFLVYDDGINNISSQNIFLYNTSTFNCICQYDYGINVDEFVYLKGCPLKNETRCKNYGEGCEWKNSYNNTSICRLSNNSNYNLLNDYEITKFIIDDKTFSGRDLIKFNKYKFYNNSNNSNNNNNKYYDNSSLVSYIYFNKLKLLSISNNIDYTNNNPILNNKSWADGILGISYSQLNNDKYRDTTSFWEVLGKKKESTMIGINLYDLELDVGGINPNYSDSLYYSEGVWYNSDYHYFETYNLEICGVELLDKYTSHYIAFIDSGATCLKLPQEIYDKLFVWIPHGSCPINETYCYLPKNFTDNLDNIELPVLSFSLSQLTYSSLHKYNINKLINIINKINPKLTIFDCVNNFSLFNKSYMEYNNTSFIKDNIKYYYEIKDLANIIFIPLKSLIINNRYCIENASSMYKLKQSCKDPLSSKYSCPISSTIIFGTRVIKNMYTALDFPNRRIGFSNIKNIKQKYINQKGNTKFNQIFSQCTKQIKCKGDEIYNKSFNTCKTPNCQKYWLYTYDKKTKQCHLHGLVILIPIIFIILVIAEYFYVYLRLYIDNNVSFVGVKV